MRQGITNFQAERLTQVREASGLTKVAVANFIKVSSAAISKWESGKQYPEESNLTALSNFFNMPLHWFLKELPSVKSTRPYFFRTNSATTNIARNIAKRKMGWTHEISTVLQKWIELPHVSLPSNHEENFLNINNFEIEELAQQCRDLWGLGFAPIPDIILAMESAGIICIRDEIGYVKMDGVSHWYGERPFIFISSDKTNGIRNRFDAAHELGHIILHSHVNTVNYKEHYKEIERQANLFAGSFLLPASSFAQNLALTTLDGFLSIKPRWKVSLAAMIMRCYQLGIINGEQKLRLHKNKSARGWATREPYDDMPAEQPRILHRSVKMLIENNIVTKATLLDELALPPQLCGQLCNLDGYFSETLDNVDNLVTLKFNKNRTSNKRPNGSSNIVAFPAR